jgi:hypothetical protein
MNKAEFKAIKKIAEKLGWKSVNFETIKQMVRNQQALELDTVGECDGDEETLLSIALWDADKIASTMYVSDYESLVMWGVYSFCDEMGIDIDTFNAMLQWNSCKMNFLAPEYEAEDITYEEYLNEYYSDFDAEMLREGMWITKHC